MRRARWWWIAGVLLVAGGVAVFELGRGSDPRPRRTAEAPEDRLVELRLEGGARFLGGLRGAVGDTPAGVLIPTTPGATLDQALPLPPRLVESIGEGSPVLGLALGAPRSAPEWVFAARIAGNTEELPEEEGLSIVRQGDVVAVGTAGAHVARVTPYLSRELGRPSPKDGLHAIVEGEAFAGEPKRWLAHQLDRLRTWALRSAEAERARHAEAPTYGEPEELVKIAYAHLRAIEDGLSDLDRATAHLGLRGGTLSLEVDLAPVTESAFARAIANGTTVPTSDLDALPPGTALAWTSAVPETKGVLSGLARIAGERLDDAGRQVLKGALDAVHEALGRRWTGHAGVDAGGSWLAVASGAGTGMPAADALRRALGVSWTRDVLGALAGCRVPEEVGAFEAEPLPKEGARHHRLALCQEGDRSSALHLAGGEGTAALWLARDEPEGPRAMFGALSGEAAREEAFVSVRVQPSAALELLSDQSVPASQAITVTATPVEGSLSLRTEVPVGPLETALRLLMGGLD